MTKISQVHQDINDIDYFSFYMYLLILAKKKQISNILQENGTIVLVNSGPICKQ